MDVSVRHEEAVVDAEGEEPECGKSTNDPLCDMGVYGDQPDALARSGSGYRSPALS